MEDNRKNLRKHIKAAADWLQQADKSIEREEDLKGDLKLMLAKAELQNAEKHQDRSRLTKILSFSTAALIALSVFWINDKSEEISQLSEPSISTTKREPLPDSPILEEIKPSAALPSLETPAEEPIINQEIIQEQTEVLHEQPPIYDNTESYNNTEIFDKESNTQSSYSSAEDLDVYYSEPADIPRETDNMSLAPTEDMQKLMQSAGQILHAE